MKELDEEEKAAYAYVREVEQEIAWMEDEELEFGEEAYKHTCTFYFFYLLFLFSLLVFYVTEKGKREREESVCLRA